MTYIIPQATRITPEEMQERKYIEDIRYRASRMSEFDVDLLAQRLFAVHERHTMDMREIQTLFYRVQRSYDYTLVDLHYAPDSDRAWSYLFDREHELMELDYAQYKATQYPEPAPAIEPVVVIPLGVYPVAELRKAIRATRRGKDDILLRVASHGMFVSDFHRLTDNTVIQMLVMNRVGIAQHALITLPGMELSYSGKNGGILDIEAEGEVTITIEGENLCFRCGNWTYRLKNWERIS